MDLKIINLVFIALLLLGGLKAMSKVAVRKAAVLPSGSTGIIPFPIDQKASHSIINYFLSHIEILKHDFFFSSSPSCFPFILFANTLEIIISPFLSSFQLCFIKLWNDVRLWPCFPYFTLRSANWEKHWDLGVFSKKSTYFRKICPTYSSHFSGQQTIINILDGRFLR